MAKSKANSKANPSVPNKHLYSRLSYLHQAAMFLGAQAQSQSQAHLLGADEKPEATPSAVARHPQSQPEEDEDDQGGSEEGKDKNKNKDQERRGEGIGGANDARLNMARYLVTNFRATSLKSQIRVSPALKHTMCKFCDALLIEGTTSTSTVENRSKGGRKPWADVLVVRCRTCGGAKRFPVQAERQKRRSLRGQQQSSRDAATKGVAVAAAVKVVARRPAGESATASASTDTPMTVD